MDYEINSIYEEELMYKETSKIYVAEDINHKMIGCIRVFKWDKEIFLPVHKLFNIDPLNYMPETENSSIWHIGRFAVDSCAGIPTISLFKKLMMYAIYPICQEQEGYMIAECDCKLLRIMSLLGMDTVRLSSGIIYLGSETIPVYANKEGLSKFYNTYISDLTIDNISFIQIKAA